jgi:hypothetical protein
MKQLVLTDEAQADLTNLDLILNALETLDTESDFKFSTYDKLLFDMRMLAKGAYCEPKFENIDIFIQEIYENTGWNYNEISKKIMNALNFKMIKINIID